MCLNSTIISSKVSWPWLWVKMSIKTTKTEFFLILEMDCILNSDNFAEVPTRVLDIPVNFTPVFICLLHLIACAFVKVNNLNTCTPEYFLRI